MVHHFVILIVINGPLVKWPKTPASHAGNTSSNLVRVTIYFTKYNTGQNLFYISVTHSDGTEVGAIGDEGPPVPIPNTEVKLISAENTWLEAARENRAVPTQRSQYKV